jgi:hypothetical protein
MAQAEGKGSDRSSSGEVTGPSMPYNGDNVSLFFLVCEACVDLKSDEMTFNYALAC